jgi:hypothetical protein
MKASHSRKQQMKKGLLICYKAHIKSPRKCNQALDVKKTFTKHQIFIKMHATNLSCMFPTTKTS